MTSVGLGRGFRTAPADAARCLTCASRAVDGRGTRGGAVVFWPIVLEPLEQDLANGPGGSDAPALAIIWSWTRESDEPRAEPSSIYASPISKRSENASSHVMWGKDTHGTAPRVVSHV